MTAKGVGVAIKQVAERFLHVLIGLHDLIKHQHDVRITLIAQVSDLTQQIRDAGNSLQLAVCIFARHHQPSELGSIAVSAAIDQSRNLVDIDAVGLSPKLAHLMRHDVGFARTSSADNDCRH